MIKAIVTDIEGTTSKISFVHEVLFPYAREHMASFVTQHQTNPHVAELLLEIRRLMQNPDASLAEVITTLEHWIDSDQKVTPLKALQGMIWQLGYVSGEFTGHVYLDAFEQLSHWHQQGIGLYVYSSGSVSAQKLIFGFSDFGDISPLFSGYFDTNVGKKQEAASYQTILSQLPYAAADVLFVSDVALELDAAQQAGMQTFQLIREQQDASTHSHGHTFHDIILR